MQLVNLNAYCALHAGLLLPALPAACTAVSAVISRLGELLKQQQRPISFLASNQRMILKLGEHLLALWNGLCDCECNTSTGTAAPVSSDSAAQYVATLPSVASLAMALSQRQLWQLHNSVGNRTRSKQAPFATPIPEVWPTAMQVALFVSKEVSQGDTGACMSWHT